MHNVLFLFRGFFPSWKFFEDCQYKITILYRTQTEKIDSVWMPWPVTEDEKKISFLHLFFNPKQNARLAIDSLISQVVQDLVDEKKTISIHILEKLLINHLSTDDRKIQFRIDIDFFETSQTETLYTSDWISSCTHR